MRLILAANCLVFPLHMTFKAFHNDLSGMEQVVLMKKINEVS